MCDYVHEHFSGGANGRRERSIRSLESCEVKKEAMEMETRSWHERRYGRNGCSLNQKCFLAKLRVSVHEKEEARERVTTAITIS